jgi:hypothetical protein
MTPVPAQGVLMDQPLYRGSDPATSRAAAQSGRESRSKDKTLALRVLRDNPDGLTDFELAALTGKQQTSIGKRRKDLERDGLVEKTEKTRPSPSGAMAIVWRAL